MKHIKWKNICLIIFAFAFSTALFAADAFDDSMLVAQQSKKAKKSNRNTNRDPNGWRPYYQSTKITEPITSFYQQSVGIGFLYFSGIKGNLNETPSTAGTPAKSNTKLSGHVGYNRTPVAEFIIGRDIWFWFKIATSYLHQGGVVLQTSPQNQSTTNGGIKPDLTTHARFDAALFRVYFMCPWTLVWKGCYYEPYLSAGVGPGWITTADIKSEGNFSNALRMKVSANCVFVIDLGAKLRKAMPTYVMSFTVGCKYIEWGQVRNIGKASSQYASSALTGSSVRQALTNPLRFQTVYSFAPYVGVQFNF